MPALDRHAPGAAGRVGGRREAGLPHLRARRPRAGRAGGAAGRLRPGPDRVHPGRPRLPRRGAPGRRHRPGRVLPARDRDRPHLVVGRRRPRVGAHRGVVPRRVALLHRLRRSRRGAARVPAGLWVADPGPGPGRRVGGPLPGLAVAQPPGRRWRALEDEMEALFDRGWTDGLPVVPPTPARVLRMLDGTTREPDEVVAVVPPDLVECTVEKVAVNAVLAGCRPEYLPVGARRGRGRLHRRVQHARSAGHDLLQRAGGDGQRSHRPRHRHELGHQRARARGTGPTPPSAGPCS